jgi:hypothetical protein
MIKNKDEIPDAVVEYQMWHFCGYGLRPTAMSTKVQRKHLDPGLKTLPG